MADFKQAKRDSKGKFVKGWKANNSRATWEYKKLAEQKMGRKLKSNEVVHHIDGNYLNNHIDNLEVMDVTEHRRLHALEQNLGNKRLSEEDKQFIIKNTQINYRMLGEMFNIHPNYIYLLRKRCA